MDPKDSPNQIHNPSGSYLHPYYDLCGYTDQKW